MLLVVHSKSRTAHDTRGNSRGTPLTDNISTHNATLSVKSTQTDARNTKAAKSEHSSSLATSFQHRSNQTPAMIPHLCVFPRELHRICDSFQVLDCCLTSPVESLPYTNGMDSSVQQLFCLSRRSKISPTKTVVSRY